MTVPYLDVIFWPSWQSTWGYTAAWVYVYDESWHTAGNGDSVGGVTER